MSYGRCVFCICGWSNINLSLSGQTTEDAGYLYSIYGTNLNIRFNPTKSCLFKIGEDFSKNVPDLCIYGQNMACVDTLKYLGMYFDTGKTAKVNTSRSVRNFCASANNILSYTRSVNDITRLHLVETCCLPLITYGLNCIFVSVSQLRKYSVYWNNVFRRLFGMHMWKSMKEIQYYCGALVILKQVISLNVCAMSTVLMYMITLILKWDRLFCPPITPPNGHYRDGWFFFAQC